MVAEVAAWFKDREELYRGGGAIGAAVDGFSDPAEALLGAFGRDPAVDARRTRRSTRLGAAFGEGDCRRRSWRR